MICNIKLFNKKNIKPILIYILMVSLYILSYRQCVFDNTPDVILTPFVEILEFIFKLFKCDDHDLYIFIYILFCAFIGLPALYYIRIKIFGICKRLDNLNFFLALFIVFLIDIALSYSSNFHVQIEPTIKFSYENKSFSDTIDYFTTILFFVYKFFHYLGKKHPKTFGKIGYYTSIEFYRELFLKIKKNIKQSI